MWKIETFSVLVQVIILISVIDIHQRLNVENKTKCNLTALADRLVLIKVGNLTLQDLVGVFDQKGTANGLGKIMLNGTIGSVVTNLNREPKDILMPIAFGFVLGPLDLTSSYSNEESIFSRMPTQYFGSSHQSFDTRDWSLYINPKIRLNNRQVLIDLRKYASKLQQKSIIFLDIPDSRERAKTLVNTPKSTIKIIEEVSLIIDKRFNDKRTAYIAFSSVGQIKKCSQLSTKFRYQNNCEEAILLTWGSGIKRQIDLKLKTVDVNSFITAILGLDPLKKSLGSVPINLLDAEIESYQTCNTMHLESLANLSLNKVHYFNSFLKVFKIIKETTESILMRNLTQIQSLTKQMKSTIKSLSQIEEVQLELSRLIYYYVLALYIGWISILLSSLLKMYLETSYQEQKLMFEKCSESWVSTTLFMIISLGSILMIFMHSWPTHYICYLILPLIVWRLAFEEMNKWKFFVLNITGKLSISITVCCLIIWSECEYIFWGSRNKYILFVVFFLAMVFYIGQGVAVHKNLLLLAVTILSAIGCIVTYFIPSSNEEASSVLMSFGCSVWLCTTGLSLIFMKKHLKDIMVMLLCSGHFIAMFVIVTIITWREVTMNLTVWPIILISPLIPILGSKTQLNRLQQIILILASDFIIFSLHHELVTIFAYAIQYLCWYLYDRLQFETEFINRFNIHYSCLFVLIVFTTLPVFGFNEDFQHINISFTDRFIKGECPFQIIALLMCKLGILILVFDVIFNAIYKKHGESHFALVKILMNLIGFRFFLDLCLTQNYQDTPPKFVRHCYTQFIIILLIAIHSIVKLMLYGSLGQMLGSVRIMFYSKQEVQKTETSISLNPFDNSF